MLFRRQQHIVVPKKILRRFQRGVLIWSSRCAALSSNHRDGRRARPSVRIEGEGCQPEEDWVTAASVSSARGLGFPEDHSWTLPRHPNIHPCNHGDHGSAGFGGGLSGSPFSTAVRALQARLLGNGVLVLYAMSTARGQGSRQRYWLKQRAKSPKIFLTRIISCELRQYWAD